MKEVRKELNKSDHENIKRHLINIAMLHGAFYHGVYYWKGVAQPNERRKNNNSKRHSTNS
jgi:hypothetical protein